MIHKKLLSLLVLLMTAASGAWAEEVTVTFTQADLDGLSTVAKDGVTLTPGNDRVHNYANLYNYGSTTFSVDKGTFKKIKIVNCYYGDISGWQREQTGSYQPDPENYPNIWQDLYTLTWTGEAKSVTFEADVFGIQSIVFTIDKPDVEVNTDKTTGETTFTEAWFTMPAFDATVNYDIVRDMEDADFPVEFSGLAERVIVKQGGDNKYQPLTTLTIQLIDDISGSDVDIISAEGIKVKVLKGTDNNGTITYDETNTLTLAEFTANMEPGLYKIVAEPKDPTTSPYTGTASLAFETLVGYPVDVAANEYVTYYSATENLTVDDEDAQLYTITAVSGSTATAEEISGANKETPFLVYNSSDKDKTIILIPTDVVIAGQTHASEFVGTATATTIAASTTEQSNYAFNGLEFVIVRTALSVAANKAWLEVPATTARNIQLVFDDATAIGAVSGSPADNGDIYDLNGRKLDKKPTRKGVYVKNGQKVIIK